MNGGIGMVRRFLFISTFVLTVTSSVGAVAVQIDDPTDGTVQHGTILFNISDNEGTSFDTVSSINISRNETTEVGINDSFGDVSTVQVSVDTQGTDGFFNYTAAAWNSSTGRLDSDTIDLTIDNTAPSFNIVSPTENSVINTTSDLNISAVQDRDTSPSVAYTLENDTGNYSTDGGSAIHGWTELSSPYETTLDPTVLVDGAYTLWVNATDDQDNTAVKSQDLTIDSAPPSITLNTPNDGALIGGTSTINFSMMDNSTTVDHDSVAVAVETTDGNRTVNDEQGWSTLDQDGAFYTTTINTTAFSEDTYDVWVRANDSSNNEAVSQYSFTFDNTAPSITTYEINETTGTSDSDIGRFSHVELGVDVQEPGETDTCRVDIIPAATWGTDDQSTERSIPLNTSGTNDFENTSADLTGLQGNYTFNAVCTDEAGNVGQQQTITTPSGSFSWFAFDAAGPEIDETSISPSNATWTDENSPSLSFDITDYTGLNQSSIALTYDGDTYTETNASISLSTSDDTTNVTMDLEDLSDDKHTIQISSEEEKRNSDPTRSQTELITVAVDTTAPTLSYDLSSGGSSSVDRGFVTWYDESVEVDFDCSDATSSIADTSVSTDGDGTVQDDGSMDYIVEADEDTEAEHELTVACEDAAGNENETTEDIGLDNRDPQISRTPYPGAVLTRTLSTDVDIDVDVTDDGAGFDDTVDDNVQGSFDPTFEGSSAGVDGSVSSDQTTISFDWTESIGSEGTYEVGLDDDSVTIEDQFGNQLSVSSWTFEVSEGDAYTTGDLVFTDTPDSVSIPRDGETSMTATIENDGNESVDVSMSAESDTDAVESTLDEDETTLSPDESFDMTVTLEATEFTEPGVLTIDAESDEEVISSTIDMEPDLAPVALRMYDVPETIETEQNTSTSFSTVIENTGDTDVDSATITGTPFPVTSDPSTPTLPYDSNTTVDLTLDIPDDARVGFTDASLTVDDGSNEVSRSFTAKIQPGDEETRTEIEDDLQALEADVENTSLQEQLTEAQNAIDQGDYARARQIMMDVQSETEGLSTADIPSSGGSGNLLINIVIGAIIVAAIILIFMLYRTRSEERDSDGYRYTTEASNYVEKIGTRLDAAATRVFDDLNQMKNRIKSTLEDEEESEEETRRKRIRFDDT